MSKLFVGLVLLIALVGLVSAHEHLEKVPLAYGVFSKECFDKLSAKGLVEFLQDKDCLIFSASKAVGYVIVLGSLIVKLPQIMKILSKSSVEGINPISYYTETITYINTAAYAIHIGLQFSVYGENVFTTV
jgi:mannose-P-dolichol utilization defect 1